MKIDDLIHLLDNRLREFKLSRDYARMSGDLARMNTADKEIISLEDTLYQLNLLIDVSKSATVKENTLAEALTDGSISVLGEYDITIYATDPKHEEKIMNILSKMGVMDTVEKIDDYINGKYWSSPVTGEMIMSAAEAYTVDARLMMAIMEQDSRFGTAGKAVRTLNPGNVGNDDDGNTRTYESWQEGVTAVAEWLNRHRGSTIIPEETVLEPTATSTPSIITPTATSTPAITTSTTTIVTTIPTATSTPSTSTTTPVTTTGTEQVSTSTPTTTTTPTTSTSTPPNQDSTSSSGTGQATTATSTTTPSSSGDSSGSTATTSPSTTTATATSTSSSGTGQASTATSTPTTSSPTSTTISTTTPVTSTSTPSTNN